MSNGHNTAAAAVLKDVLENGLIYWEPQTSRGRIEKALMVERIRVALAQPSDIELAGNGMGLR